MNPDYEYFMSRRIEEYAGDWVIIINKKVVAHGPRKKMKHMLQHAKNTYPGEALLVAKVPQRAVQIL
jgi:hypothetical protein